MAKHESQAEMTLARHLPVASNNLQYLLARDRRIVPVSIHACRLTGQPASENRENCGKARTTLLHHNVSRKAERDGSKSSRQG